jgi:hypothetical protein
VRVPWEREEREAETKAVTRAQRARPGAAAWDYGEEGAEVGGELGGRQAPRKREPGAQHG